MINNCKFCLQKTFVYCVDLRIKSYYFPTKISLSVFMTEAERAYRGTDWALNATVASMSLKVILVYRKVIGVCSVIHTNHINSVCEHNAALLNVKLFVYTVLCPAGFSGVNQY
jgi:hypothetical protein